MYDFSPGLWKNRIVFPPCAYTFTIEYFWLEGNTIRILQKQAAKEKDYALLKDDLHQTARDLADAYNNLENVVDPDLIDCYIYELNSVQMRYKFLLARIKKLELGWIYLHSAGNRIIITTLSDRDKDE